MIKTLFRSTLIVLLLLCLGLRVHSQGKSTINSISKKNIVLMKERTLAVILIDPDDPRYFKAYNKKPPKNDKFPDRKSIFTEFATNYNTQIKKIIDKHWSFNAKVEYIKLRDFQIKSEEEKNEYAALFLYRTQEMSLKSAYYPQYLADKIVGKINGKHYFTYDLGKGNGSFGFTFNNGKENGRVMKEEYLTLQVKMLQQMLISMSETPKYKPIFHTKLANNIADACKIASTSTTIIIPEYLTKYSVDELKKNYAGEILIVNDEEYAEYILNPKENISIYFPLSYSDSGVSFDLGIKLLVNPKDGSIIDAARYSKQGYLEIGPVDFQSYE